MDDLETVEQFLDFLRYLERVTFGYFWPVSLYDALVGNPYMIPWAKIFCRLRTWCATLMHDFNVVGQFLDFWRYLVRDTFGYFWQVSLNDALVDTPNVICWGWNFYCGFSTWCSTHVHILKTVGQFLDFWRYQERATFDFFWQVSLYEVLVGTLNVIRRGWNLYCQLPTWCATLMHDLKTVEQFLDFWRYPERATFGFYCITVWRACRHPKLHPLGQKFVLWVANMLCYSLCSIWRQWDNFWISEGT